MRTRYAASIALAGLLLAGAHRLRAQQQAGANPAVPPETVAWLRYLADELRMLRVEVGELRVAVEGARMPDLERIVLAVQAERQRLEEDTLAHAQEIESLDLQLAQPALPAAEMQQLTARKAELAAELNGKLRTRRETLAAEEAAARDRLDVQQRRFQTALARRSELIAAQGNR